MRKKDEVIRLLNEIEIVELSVYGTEIEYALVEDNETNALTLNAIACMCDNTLYNGMTDNKAVEELREQAIESCLDEGHLDLAYFVYSLIDMDTSKVKLENKEWYIDDYLRRKNR